MIRRVPKKIMMKNDKSPSKIQMTKDLTKGKKL